MINTKILYPILYRSSSKKSESKRDEEDTIHVFYDKMIE